MTEQVGYRVRGRIGAIFLARHAISAEDAISFHPELRDVRAFERLRGAGVVRRRGDGAYWFDLPAYFTRADAISRKATIVSFFVAVIGAIVAMLFYRG